MYEKLWKCPCDILRFKKEHIPAEQLEQDNEARPQAFQTECPDCGSIQDELDTTQSEIEPWMLKRWALARYENDDQQDWDLEDEDEGRFSLGRREFRVLTDEEADKAAEEYIKGSLWAFNADFIIDHSKLPYDAIEMVKGYQESKCEGANDTIEALIEDMDEFVKDAISADGRGHFMSSYDGEENEETVEGETFYIYRQN